MLMQSDAITIVALNANKIIIKIKYKFIMYKYVLYFILTPVLHFLSYQIMNILHFDPL